MRQSSRMHVEFHLAGSPDVREVRRALAATRGRELMGLPARDGVPDFRESGHS